MAQIGCASMDKSKPVVSIGVPGIRTESWEQLADSIERTLTSHTFEIIFVGPFDPPPALLERSYVKFIKDFGCPSRALQISSTHASGTIFTWAVDDGVLNEGSLDDQISFFLSYPPEQKKILNLENELQWANDKIENYQSQLFENQKLSQCLVTKRLYKLSTHQ